jgi:hypothetical protein
MVPAWRRQCFSSSCRLALSWQAASGARNHRGRRDLGLVQRTAQIGGPPVVSYWQRRSRDARANIILFLQ